MDEFDLSRLPSEDLRRGTAADGLIVLSNLAIIINTCLLYCNNAVIHSMTFIDVVNKQGQRGNGRGLNIYISNYRERILVIPWTHASVAHVPLYK